MSIFQLMPDLWALGQLFPIAPIHRLDERPSEWATLVDITCDSGGKIEKFGDVREDQDALRLHKLRKEPYYLGAFLLGAYQDVMGDFHNMLGETKEAMVVAVGAGEVEISPVKVKCQRTGEVLELFGHRNKDMRATFDAAIERARNNGGADRTQL